MSPRTAVLSILHGWLLVAAGGLAPLLAPASLNAGEISATQLRPHIERLADPALSGRRGPGRILARDYIIEHFEKFGVQPLFEGSWLQELPGHDGKFQPEPDGENIGGFIRGTDPRLRDEWIVINAHYDHLGVRNGRVYPGADDNASGVSMLLEVARQLAERPLARSVAFVAFDGEESLLWGSRWFIAHTPMPLEQIRLCVTADMIGRSLGGLGLPTVFVLGAEHSTMLRDLFKEIDVPQGLDVAQLGADMIGTRSDYGPFREQEIPFLFFSTGEHPDYHTPQDTADRIDYDKAARISTLILRLVEEIGNSPVPPEWESPEYQNLEEARAVQRITQQLMAADEAQQIRLSGTQRFLVSQVQNKTAYMVRTEKVSDDERKWLARMAQLLLLSVF